MLKSVQKYKNILSKDLTYAINHCVNTENMTNFEKELASMKFNGDFIVYITGRKYVVNSLMSKQDAEIVLCNIENIDYIYSEEDSFDSVVGDISSFILNNFACKKYDFEYIKAKFLYIKFISNLINVPKETDIIEYINKELCNNET